MADTYGIKVVDAYGNDFVETYRPFNVIDAFIPSANGSKTYTLYGGRIYVSSTALCIYSNMSWYRVRISGGTVTWTLNGAQAASGDLLIPQGHPVFVIRGT